MKSNQKSPTTPRFPLQRSDAALREKNNTKIVQSEFIYSRGPSNRLTPEQLPAEFRPDEQTRLSARQRTLLS
jgi:hypothetical protein